MPSPATFSWQPPPDSGIHVAMVAANGLQFEVAMAGDPAAKRVAILLHGFPELNVSWRHQMPLLAEIGWRVWAPNLRGYGATSRPDGVEAYRVNHLAEDVCALIDAAVAEVGGTPDQAGEVMLVAHDWGALIAWNIAIRKLRPLCRLVIMNVPHPRCFMRELECNRAQRRKSWYIRFFQIPRLPEWALRRRGAAAIRRAFTDSAANKANFPPDILQIYADAARRPGALTAMVNYYRALRRFPDLTDIGDGKVDVPTLMVWGEADVAIDIACTHGTDAYVDDLSLHILPGISHWVQQDAPERVNAILRDWLAPPTA